MQLRCLCCRVGTALPSLPGRLPSGHHRGNLELSSLGQDRLPPADVIRGDLVQVLVVAPLNLRRRYRRLVSRGGLELSPEGIGYRGAGSGSGLIVRWDQVMRLDESDRKEQVWQVYCQARRARRPRRLVIWNLSALDMDKGRAREHIIERAGLVPGRRRWWMGQDKVCERPKAQAGEETPSESESRGHHT